jgi:N-acetylmuramoyl-L-alanine amidase
MKIFKHSNFAEILATVNEAGRKINAANAVPEKNRLRYLVIHCSATPEDRDFTIEDIRRWHTAPKSQGGRGWKQVGYSDVIYRDGTVVNMVPYDEDAKVDPWEITNGVTGVNSNSRHIVYIGGTDKAGKPKDTRTAEQIEDLKIYCKNAIRLWPGIQIAGHNQFANKACPSFDVPTWLRSIGIPEACIYKGGK